MSMMSGHHLHLLISVGPVNKLKFIHAPQKFTSSIVAKLYRYSREIKHALILDLFCEKMTLHQETLTPVALTIAGLDPSGGAGIIADIKTFTAFGCFATAVVTSLTFQNTTGVFGAEHQSADAVRAQVLPLVQDFRIACVKTGMLPTREIIVEVARLFRETELPAPVVDPVVRSTSGYDLIDDDALASLRDELLPLARVLTPNIPETERLTGLRVIDEEGMSRAAHRLREMGARAVLIKGGHLAGQSAGQREPEANAKSSVPDVLDEDGRVTVFRGERIETNSTHGTGCTLAAAITACLGRGLSLQDSIGHAKRFVTEALRQAHGLGQGFGPINHSPRTVTSDELKRSDEG